VRLPRMKPGDLLVIKLYDLTGHSSWLPDEKAQEFPAMECAVCGWYINRDKNVLRLSSMIAADGDKTILVIPKGFLKSVKVVSYDKS